MHRILIADPLAKQGLDILTGAADVHVDELPSSQPSDLVAEIKPYHALIVRSSSRVTADVIAAAENLKVIGRAGIGVDNIDVSAATKKGIVVMNTPVGNSITTAEHTIGMLLASARRIPQACALLKAGSWAKQRFIGTELYAKTLGIIGIGNVGKLVAERAQGLGMRIVAHDPYLSIEAAHKLNIEVVALNELCRRADFITVHTPLTNETRGLLDAESFQLMKKGVQIINCARGGIVDEAALADAILSGKVAAAALDVFASEPPEPNDPLLQLDEVICTPHLGAATDEAQVKVSEAIATQVLDYLRHGTIQDSVNFPGISGSIREAIEPYLNLSEKLGSFHAQMLEGAPTDIAIECSGDVTRFDLRLVKLAFLRGFLCHVLEPQGVNYVNAQTLATERGISVTITSASEAKGFTNLISSKVSSSGSTNVVAGSIFGKGITRLVRMNNFFLDVRPEGHMLVLHNRDVPGVVGAVGALLGRSGVNIARLELGREEAGQIAVSLFQIDSEPPKELLEELRSVPNILAARRVHL